MSTLPNEHSKIELAMFDSFSKSVMRHCSSKLATAADKIHQSEILNLYEDQYILETQGKNDIYPSEHIITDRAGHECLVTIDWLYQAMILLTEKQKEVLILEFWYGFSIYEISKTLQISERSVFERKRNAFKEIKKYYERNVK